LEKKKRAKVWVQKKKKSLQLILGGEKKKETFPHAELSFKVLKRRGARSIVSGKKGEDKNIID